MTWQKWRLRIGFNFKEVKPSGLTLGHMMTGMICQTSSLPCIVDAQYRGTRAAKSAMTWPPCLCNRAWCCMMWATRTAAGCGPSCTAHR